MNRQIIKFLHYVHTFIESILKSGVELRTAALYGSIVDGDLSPTSDIDIKIFTLKKSDIKIISERERDINKKILRDGYKNYIHSIVSTKPEAEHLGNGILVFGKPIIIKSKEKELFENNLITYDTTGLPKNTITKMSIRLFGHKLKRGNKIYSTEGVLTSLKGKRLRNGILIDVKDSKIIENIFKENNVKFEVATIYSSAGNKYMEKF